MNGEAIDIPGNQDRPYIEFHLADARYMGNDGCIAFQGSIRQITEDRISLEPAESTDQYCEPTPWSRQFMDRLNRVKAYNREGLELDLLDASGQTLLTFKKID
jgi:heat shock protein HslJ